MAAWTFKRDGYNMTIVGTFIMASPTFFLAIGPSVPLLFAYIFIMSIGEAMWQPRFFQMAAELAPEGKTGQYIGIAQLPWFMTKLLTSLYSGTMLASYIPEQGPQNSEMLWMIYGFIAMSTPVILWFARSWMSEGLKKAGSEETQALDT